MLKKISLVIIILGVFLVGCSQSPSQLVKKQEYKIGAILPLSGAGTNLGQPMFSGMRLAIQEINDKGGANGYKIKLITQDNKLDVKDSATAANHLVEIEKIDIASVLFGLPADTVSPIFKKNKTPFIFEAYTRSDNPYAFKSNYDALTGCQALTKYAKENNQCKQLGVLMSRVPYNDLCL